MGPETEAQVGPRPGLRPEPYCSQKLGLGSMPWRYRTRTKTRARAKIRPKSEPAIEPEPGTDPKREPKPIPGQKPKAGPGSSLTLFWNKVLCKK